MAGILSRATKEKIMDPIIQVAALDGTGFESHHVSNYFVKRKERTSASECHERGEPSPLS